MAFEISEWRRLEWDGVPVYVRPDKPCWFVPSSAGDVVLRGLPEGIDVTPDVAAFLARLPDAAPPAHSGRTTVLGTPALRELWLHLTNRCNMACTHCLFASGPDSAEELATHTALELVDDALNVGCRVFALTGGEPMLHPGFDELVTRVLEEPAAHVAVLTNATLLPGLADRLQSWGADRFHVQVSVDGLGPTHDAVRGVDAFSELEKNIGVLQELGFPFTLSVAVQQSNVAELPGIVDFAAAVGAAAVHGMWYFVRGRGTDAAFVSPDVLCRHLLAARQRGEVTGVAIDNLEALAGQVFAPSGTIHDGTSGGWESAAIGPDGLMYPSAATVGVPDLASPIRRTLIETMCDSPVLQQVRAATVREHPSPLRFLTGGGDLDHSYARAGTYSGDDPYVDLYDSLVLWLIASEAAREPDTGKPALRLKMGDRLRSCGPHEAVALTHSNCLLSVASGDARASVGEFYANAAVSTHEDILNPVCYPEGFIAHIPDEYRFRGYGCGSPVMDAELAAGETVCDLGSGRGIECFVASRLVGREGRVVGIDMLDPMLDAARQACGPVAERLGFGNVEFRKGFLEALPLEDGCADVVLSNCVLNLSPDKRRTFAEILRVLRPGGRLVVSDVVCDAEPDAAIRNDEALRGECIAGALTHRDLMGLLRETGFERLYAHRRFPYRVVGGHPFFSLTFEARKPLAVSDDESVNAMYRGPLASVTLPGGRQLPAGSVESISRQDADRLGDHAFVFGDAGDVTNVEFAQAGCCCAAPSAAAPGEEAGRAACDEAVTGCLVCGAPVTYMAADAQLECHQCGDTVPSNAKCANGHFICDACHSASVADWIETQCVTSRDTDMLTMFRAVRSHPGFPVHGPEHHGLVPGVILSTYRNLGGDISDDDIVTGVRRGIRVAGGLCGVAGLDGTAAGAGIAFGILLKSSPTRAAERQATMQVVQRVLAAQAEVEGGRCCQRESWVALRKVAELSGEFLPLPLRAADDYECEQQALNEHCIGADCPVMKETRRGHSR